MASDEHKSLAHYLKEVHSSLRKASCRLGAEQAWQEHCDKKGILKTYAYCMEKLATTHWTENANSESSKAVSRIKWNADFCHDYFVNKSFLKYRLKEKEIASKINATILQEESFSDPIKLCDVGSCYNPFSIYDFLDVLAIDLFPANNLVYECDFLNVSIGSKLDITDFKVTQLCENYFDVVTFCFVLEYIPSPDLRLKACENAYNILKSGGLLLINTPDSKHVGANSKIMKCWQYTLANIGFSRLKYEKFKHMHCMAFRKAISKDTAVRWASLHRKAFMQYAIYIPQDFVKEIETEESSNVKIETSVDDFQELPFCDSEYRY